ncbi:MAG: DegT/DnrJ/EryC1/StrS family aminotransferase [Desulfotomaculales bacterium]
MKVRVLLARPDVGEAEAEAVAAVVRSGRLSLGPRLREFEERMASFVGCGHAVGVSSGTAALHLVVRALGLAEGDEVITTPFSFIASANCLLFERVRPVFVDIDPRTLNLDPDLVERAVTPRTRAILVVHVFGHPADMNPLLEVASRYGLAVIEDACEAIGARYRGRLAGTFGQAGVFAFYPNKQMTTGEGGMIVTDDPEVAALCRSMRNQGRSEAGGWFDHERLGYNYRMDELSAALGVVQLARLPEMLAKRARIAAMYTERLRGLPEVKTPYVAPEVQMSWFVYVIRVARHVNRDRVMAYLRDRGIECRPYFAPIHLQPFYRRTFGYKEGDFPVAEDAGRRVIALPFYNSLTEAEIDYVVDILRAAINRN